jgi:hypothetical protein
MDAFYDSIDKTMANMYATTEEGKRYDINAVEYSIVRETAPIYTLGSPMPSYHTRGSKYVSGTLYLPEDTFYALMDSDGDTFTIGIEQDGKEITLEGADIIGERYIHQENRYICEFICKRITKEKALELENLSKRELAKHLLDKEY